jgi:hypothetical protein
VLDLIPRLRTHFDPLRDHFDCFCRYGVQLEGWFKGELLVAFDAMRRERHIDDFDREVRVGKKQVDFRLDIATAYHWVELKFWLIGRQKGTNYAPSFYFSDPTSVGISNDVDALVGLCATGNRWLLILMAARPSEEAWNAGIASHNKKFRHQLIPRTMPNEFPSEYFLGLLEVAGQAATDERSPS